MEISGHRGARGSAPENTATGITEGIRQGADWIEFDVRATKEGYAILMHDPIVFGRNKWPYVVKFTAFSQLQKVVPHELTTLSEALRTIGNRAKINIELKTPACAELVAGHIATAVANGASYDDFLVSSFKPRCLRIVHKVNPRIPLALLHYKRAHRFRSAGIPLKAVGFWYKHLPQKAIDFALAHNLTVYAYTVNDVATARSLKKRGVTHIVTDFPAKLKNKL